MSELKIKTSEARQGWKYLAKLTLAAFAILFGLTTLKFSTQHKLAPKNFGLGGALAQPRLDLLLIGSSHTRKSYDMRLLEKQTGVTDAYQISYDGTDLTMVSQLLDYLAARPEHCPRHLVVEAYSAMLARRPELQDPRYFADAPPPLKMEILRAVISDKGYWATFLDDFDLIVNRGNEEIIAYPIYSRVVKNGSYKGGRSDFDFPGMTPAEFAKIKPGINGSVPDPAQVAALDRIINTARSHGIQLIFIDTPMPQPVSSNPVIQLLKSDYRQILDSRHATYIDADKGFPIDDPALFSDSNHLSSKGRKEFTPQISAVLKAWMTTQPAGESRAR